MALGAGWLVFPYPPIARATYPYAVLASLGEAPLVLWLSIKGVDEKCWREQAGPEARW